MKQDIFDSLKSFYIILKVFGLTLFNFNRKTLQIEDSFFNCCYLVLLVVFWIGCVYLEAQAKDPFGIPSVLLENLWAFQYSLMQVLVPVTMIYAFFKRKSVERFLKMIDNFDKSMDKLHLKQRSDKKSCICVVWSFILSLLVMSAYVVTFFTDLQSKQFEVDFVECYTYAAYDFTNMIFLLLSFQFILAVQFISNRLKSIVSNFE